LNCIVTINDSIVGAVHRVSFPPQLLVRPVRLKLLVPRNYGKPCQRSSIYSSLGDWSLTEHCAFLASWRSGTTQAPTIRHKPNACSQELIPTPSSLCIFPGLSELASKWGYGRVTGRECDSDLMHTLTGCCT
jgi:hypothetical protein